MRKMSLLLGGAVGFVLGSRAGRGPYEQLEQLVRRATNQPGMQRLAHQAKRSTSDVADTASAAVSSLGDHAQSTINKATSSAGAAVDHAASKVEQAVRPGSQKGPGDQESRPSSGG
jgi:ElaB/YqjD/DUF883 family membrane-anchored ribosome-binding protein